MDIYVRTRYYHISFWRKTTRLYLLSILTMKKFSIHISTFLIILVISILAVFYVADGYADSFYLKISSSKQKNLILGTSKAAQGVQPQV